MATKKMTKVETPVETEPVEAQSSTVTVDADALIKSILNNTNQQTKSVKKYVLCRSVTNGGLHINCRSGNVYDFKDYGYECEIEYDDLVALVRKHSDHVFIPRFVIEDDDFLGEFAQISKAYETMYTKEDIDEVFELPVSQMMAEIQAMPQSLKNNIQSLIASKISDGSIDSVKKIHALSEYFDSDFNLLSQLFSR